MAIAKLLYMMIIKKKKNSVALSLSLASFPSFQDKRKERENPCSIALIIYPH